MLKIIAGKHRGRRIETHPGSRIRPTGGMARGAIFNILAHGNFGPNGQPPLVGQDALDLFCGTGALGLEALSRGAAHVTFIDQAQESLTLARSNVAHMGEESAASFIRSDSTSLPRARRQASLAFLDPPYDSGLAVKSLKSLHQQGWLVENAVAVVELSHREILTPPEHFTLFDEREYGNTKIVFLRHG